MEIKNILFFLLLYMIEIGHFRVDLRIGVGNHEIAKNDWLERDHILEVEIKVA